jgi:hypothetical protein
MLDGAATAGQLMINTPAGIEGMFRLSGRDKSLPRPDGYQMSPAVMARAALPHRPRQRSRAR